MKLKPRGQLSILGLGFKPFYCVSLLGDGSQLPQPNAVHVLFQTNTAGADFAELHNLSQSEEPINSEISFSVFGRKRLSETVFLYD